jgi:hypothetical protein
MNHPRSACGAFPSQGLRRRPGPTHSTVNPAELDFLKDKGMNPSLVSRLLGGLALGGGTASALAHDGHGLVGAHWHATDVWGYVALAVLIAAAVWWTGRGK